jgi:hypothetical protein
LAFDRDDLAGERRAHAHLSRIDQVPTCVLGNLSWFSAYSSPKIAAISAHAV